jgi:hypothetical protein
LQETKKKESFDDAFVRNFCPPAFDQYVVLPSVGASGGAIIIWKSHLFHGSLIFQNSYALSVELNSRIMGITGFLQTSMHPVLL